MSRELHVAEVLAERCSDLTVESIEWLGDGDFCEAYLVNRRWVVRVAKHGDAMRSLRREVCLLSRLVGRFEVSVPTFEFAHLDDLPAFAAHRLLPGPDLSKDRYLALPEADHESCAGQVARFLRELHGANRQLAQSCGLEPMDFNARCADVLADTRECAFDRLGPADREFAESRLTSGRADNFEPVVLHGDLSPDHVMFDDTARRVSGIIDFGDVAIGDPAWDFVYIYEDYGLDFLARALRSYSPLDPSSFLERIYGFYVLDLVAWAVECAEAASDELGAAVAELTRLRVDEDRRRAELFGACLG